MNEPTSHPHAIVGIRVEGLYGYINQDLNADDGTLDGLASLAILYGENGSGKSTLLRLAFDMISPRVDRGHKSRVASTPFSSLCVSLRDGTTFEASKARPDIPEFDYTVTRPRGKPLKQHFALDPDSESVPPYRFRAALRRAITTCASTIIFLRDDRQIEIEANTKSPSPWDDYPDEFRNPRGRRRKLTIRERDEMRRRAESDQLGAALRAAINRLNQWFGSEYSRRTSTGMASAHAVYGQIIDRILSMGEHDAPGPTTDSLVVNLTQLSDQSDVLDKYGLAPSMDVKAILGSLDRADAQQQRVVGSLLEPYIETTKARFGALQEIFDPIDTFIRLTNKFLAPKRVTYHVGEGLKVESPRTQPLGPSELSSGERQLLLLFSTAALPSRSPTIFMIDEPEISLNTTWQRALVGALLELSSNSTNQFIMASHSLSLITKHRDHVMRLKRV